MRIKMAYDYEELIRELKEELEDEILTMNDVIQILRSDKVITDNYKPITDWYYNDDTMKELFKQDIFDDEKDIEETKKLKSKYEEEKTKLEVISVKECLSEMEEWNKIA